MDESVIRPWSMKMTLQEEPRWSASVRPSFDEVASCAFGCVLALRVNALECCISTLKRRLPHVALSSPPVAQKKAPIQRRGPVKQTFCIHCGIQAEQAVEADFALLFAKL